MIKFQQSGHDNPQKLSAKQMIWPSEDYKAFRHIHFSSLPDDMAAVYRKDRKIGILKLSTPETPISELLVVNIKKGNLKYFVNCLAAYN
jgi:hypothetical protein